MLQKIKNWIIKDFGGFTADEVVKESRSYALEELRALQYEMEENYGNNWTADLYEKVNTRIIELTHCIYD